jgi:hypothetical protein
MSITNEKRRIMDYLRDPEVRPLFVSDHIKELIALQIRLLREKKGWTQTQLGEHAGGMLQPRIAALEDPDYKGGVNRKTLERLAAAFDVALILRFAPFSELVDSVSNLSPQRLTPLSFDEESKLGLSVTTPPVASRVQNASATTYVSHTGSSFGTGDYGITSQPKREKELAHAA